MAIFSNFMSIDFVALIIIINFFYFWTVCSVVANRKVGMGRGIVRPAKLSRVDGLIDFDRNWSPDKINWIKNHSCL